MLLCTHPSLWEARVVGRGTQKHKAGNAGPVPPWVFIDLSLRTEHWRTTQAGITANTSPRCRSSCRSRFHGRQLGGRPSGCHMRISFPKLPEPRLSGLARQGAAQREKTLALSNFTPYLWTTSVCQAPFRVLGSQQRIKETGSSSHEAFRQGHGW